MADRFTQFLMHPATQMAAGIMAGSDPNQEGLGGVGQGIMTAGQAVRQQQLEQQRQEALRLQQQQQMFKMQQAQVAAEQAEQQRRARQSYLSTLDPELAAQLEAFPSMAEDILNPKPLVVPHRASIYEDGGFRRPEGAEQNPLELKDRFQMEQKLRGDFDKSTAAFREVASAWNSIQAMGDSPPEQLALVTKIMKMLDPGSVVRESEIGMAMGTAGLLDQMLQIARKVQSGDVLGKKQLRRFRNLGKKLYDASVRQYQRLNRNYTRRAKQYKLDPSNVITDYALENPGSLLPVEDTEEDDKAFVEAELEKRGL